MRPFLRRGAAFATALLTALSLSAGVFASEKETSLRELRAFSASLDGDTLHLDMEGDTWWHEIDPVTFAYADGSSTHAKLTITNSDVSLWLNGAQSWEWSAAAAGTLSRSGEHYTAHIELPTSALRSDSFDLTLAGVTVSAAELGGMAASDDEEADGEAERPGRIKLAPDTRGRITVDGDLSDWGGVAGSDPKDGPIREWKLARDVDGNVYLALSGTAESEWDSSFLWKTLSVYQQGRNWNKPLDLQIAALAGETGGEMKSVNGANRNTAGPFAVEAMLPAAYFTDPDYVLALGGASFAAASLPVLDGEDFREEKPDAVYGGISVDGDFSDWDAVVKQDVSDRDTNGTLAEAAMVFDGDMIYVYLRENAHKSVGGAGEKGNAKFTLQTDLGYQVLFQLPWDGDAVLGIEGARAARVGERWEIAIPASCLPSYQNTVSLGLYQGASLVEGVANRGAGKGGGTFSGIVCDGHYSDWEFYPHSLIQYATAGTGENVPDGESALYYSAQDNRIYGHVRTEMPAHLAEGGGEFASAVTFRFNGDAGKDLGVMLAYVDGAGNIDWNAASRILGAMEEGETRSFGVFDLQTWHSSPNVNRLSVDSDRMYGEMYITRAAGRDECEFYLDLSALAAKYGLDENEFHEIAARFGKIGQEWVTTAGASSGAWLGVGLSCAVVCGVALNRRRRKEAGAR